MASTKTIVILYTVGQKIAIILQKNVFTLLRSFENHLKISFEKKLILGNKAKQCGGVNSRNCTFFSDFSPVRFHPFYFISTKHNTYDDLIKNTKYGSDT